MPLTHHHPEGHLAPLTREVVLALNPAHLTWVQPGMQVASKMGAVLKNPAVTASHSSTWVEEV